MAARERHHRAGGAGRLGPRRQVSGNKKALGAGDTRGATAFGNFTLTVDGTYVHKYEYQDERGGPYTQNVGRYAANNPVFRWKHNAALNWRQGVWAATLAQSFKSGYTDQNLDIDDEFLNKVPSYSLWNLSGTYTGFKGVSLTAGGTRELLRRQAAIARRAIGKPLGEEAIDADKTWKASYGDPLELGSFTYRAIAGLVFSGMYLLHYAGPGVSSTTH